MHARHFQAAFHVSRSNSRLDRSRHLRRELHDAGCQKCFGGSFPLQLKQCSPRRKPPHRRQSSLHGTFTPYDIGPPSVGLLPSTIKTRREDIDASIMPRLPLAIHCLYRLRHDAKISLARRALSTPLFMLFHFAEALCAIVFLLVFAH